MTSKYIIAPMAIALASCNANQGYQPAPATNELAPSAIRFIGSNEPVRIYDWTDTKTGCRYIIAGHRYDGGISMTPDAECQKALTRGE